MTREQYSRILHCMEGLRMDSYEAETQADARRMMREYRAMERMIAPYALGQTAFETADSSCSNKEQK